MLLRHKVSRIRLLAALSVLLLLALPEVAVAERLPLKTYTTADGLIRDEIRSIFQDSRGYIWFITPSGLSRFDGYGFTNYGAERGIPFASINRMIEDREGGYWVGTNGGGLFRFRPYEARWADPTAFEAQPPPAESLAARFEKYPLGDDENNRAIYSLYQDSRGLVWAGTSSALFCLDRAAEHASFQRVELPGRARVGIWSILEDRGGNLWVGTSGGLLRRLPGGRLVRYRMGSSEIEHTAPRLVDREGRIWVAHGNALLVLVPEPEADLSREMAYKISNARAGRSDRIILPSRPGESCLFTKAHGLSSTDLLGACQLLDGRVWMVSSNGLIEFDGSRFQTYKTDNGLSTNVLRALAADAYGNIWIGTDTAGAMRIAQSGFTTFMQSDGLAGENLWSIFENRAGELCVLMDGVIINQFNGRGFDSTRFVLPEKYQPQPNFGHQSTIQDHTGQWWVATDHGLYRFPEAETINGLARTHPKAVYKSGRGLPGDNVFRLFEDSRGDILIGLLGSTGARVVRWDRATEKFHPLSPGEEPVTHGRATALCQDKHGNIWVGLTNGLARYASGRFTIFTPDDGVPEGMVRDLYSDSAGRLWIATSRGGLGRIDDTAAERPGVIVYTTARGLADMEVNCVTEDLFGFIYVGMGRGLDRLDPESGRIKHYTNSDGLTNIEVLRCLRGRDGSLWFGTRKGVARLAPRQEQPEIAPPVLITGLRVAGAPVTISDLGDTRIAALELRPDQNNLQIEFLSLDFGIGRGVKYQYRLDGAGGDWSAPADQKIINLASLQPGDYRFMVRAISPDGATSETPALVSFKILPPVWQRWWFAAILLIMAGSVALAFVRARARRLAALRESEKRFRALAETASDAIFAVDEQSRIVFVNLAAQHVFGYTVEEMMGREIGEVIPRCMRALRMAGFGGGDDASLDISWDAREVRGIHKQGKDVPLELSFGEFTRGDTRFFTVIARDVTERKRAEEALRKSREERLTELEQVRRRIATDLHDDIGASLSQISLLSEVVRQRVRDDSRVSEPLSLISTASHELVNSMSDIVWAINPHKDHFADLVHRMRRFASDTMTARNITFQFRAPEAYLDIRLGANIRREVFLIFKESINNLARHSECTEAGIEFSIADDQLVLKVEDNGRGFDLSSNSMGHGLTSMRGRAEGIGGRLNLVTAPGLGTTVTLTAPLGQASAAP